MLIDIRVRRVSLASNTLLAAVLIGERLTVVVNPGAGLLSDHAATDHARQHVDQGRRVFVCDETCPLWQA